MDSDDSTGSDKSNADGDDSKEKLGYSRPGPSFQFVKQVTGNEFGTEATAEVGVCISSQTNAVSVIYLPFPSLAGKTGGRLRR